MYATYVCAQIYLLCLIEYIREYQFLLAHKSKWKHENPFKQQMLE